MSFESPIFAILCREKRRTGGRLCLFFCTGNLYYFKIFECAFVGSEPYKRANRLPPLQTRCPGIYMEQSESFVVFHFQNMGMPAYEKFRRTAHNLFPYAAVVVSGISSYMFHQHFGTFAVPTQFFGIHYAQVAAVAIAANGAKRLYFVKTLGYFHAAYVACVPNLVAFREILPVFLVPIAMSVRQKPYAFHGCLLFCRARYAELFLYEFGNKFRSAFNAENAGIYAKVISVGRTPGAVGIEVVILRTLLVALANKFLGGLRGYDAAQTKPLYAVGIIGGNKNIGATFLVAKHIVGTTSYEYARMFGGNFLYSLALNAE